MSHAAAYAANDAPAFPEESSTTLVMPFSTREPNSTAVPRSLNEPLGSEPSSFRSTEELPHANSSTGVCGSPRETIRETPSHD
jgi:hypothetical protein